MVTSSSPCSANLKVQFTLLKVVNLYLFTAEYSSRQKLLDSNLESSTRVTQHSPCDRSLFTMCKMREITRIVSRILQAFTPAFYTDPLWPFWLRKTCLVITDLVISQVCYPDVYHKLPNALQCMQHALRTPPIRKLTIDRLRNAIGTSRRLFRFTTCAILSCLAQ